MAEAKQVDEWNRVSLMCVLLANPHRDTDKRPEPFDIPDFHPFIPQPQKKRHKRSAAELFAKIESVGGNAPSVVTGTEPWVQHQKSKLAGPQSG